ncbi:MAG: hypothetical protein ACPG3Z_06680, partial [Saprospiraceae bacterium]
MYLAPSNLGKFGAALETINNVSSWEKETTIDTTLIKDGYVLFEKVSTKVKKKTDDLMLQILNPSFSQNIKVYHDPLSYYIKKAADKSAYRLLKKDYKEQFADVFGDCPELMEKYGDNIKWNEFETHIYEYTQLMKK